MAAWHFAIDRGGTFTDVFATHAITGEVRVLKLLSEDAAHYPDAPSEGIRQVLEAATGIPHPRGAPLSTASIASIRMGTTVATNALLERTGARSALVVTRGFKDILFIGTQARPRIFDLRISTPVPIYEAVVELEERVMLPLAPTPGKRHGLGTPPPGSPVTWTGADGYWAPVPGMDVPSPRTGEVVRIVTPPDLAALSPVLQSLRDRGVTSLAVVLKHSALYPAHEESVGELATRLGFDHVSLSSAVSPVVRMVPRGSTAAAGAYLSPSIRDYVAKFRASFDGGLARLPLLFMQSDGALASVDAFAGHMAVLSGPAGGYIGYAATSHDGACPPGQRQPVVGFDMGGTSTDVSRFAGVLEHLHESVTAGVAIHAPQCDISTVAAGGGSRLTLQPGGLLAVGPESVGAHPGPVCYRNPGGGLAVTDANVVLGRLQPAFFPAIFGPAEAAPLDASASFAAMAALAAELNASRGAGRPGGPSAVTPDELAYGFLEVAHEAMCRPLRALTQSKGHDLSTHALSAFGGAAGQHACALARALGITTVLVSRFGGVLSAVGIALAEVASDVQEPSAVTLGPDAANILVARGVALAARAAAQLTAQLQGSGGGGAGTRGTVAPYTTQVFLNLRYEGTDAATMTPLEVGGGGDAAAAAAVAACGASFESGYARDFGFSLAGKRRVVVDDIRARVATTSGSTAAGALGPGPCVAAPGLSLPPPARTVDVFFEPGGRRPTPVYHAPGHAWGGLPPGSTVCGPALLINALSTVVLDPGCVATVTGHGDLNIHVPAVRAAEVTSTGGGGDETAWAHPAALAVFAHRFMGVAEQMGRALQRTAVSVNIKERLDFSCALFDGAGGLVANAPHIPVHLGAMQEAVRYQLRHWGPGGLKQGDVLLSNHPQLAGGSHLPDMTVISPFFAGAGAPAFFVASRGHHSDIGGLTPGSMPPNSTLLAQEGAAIIALKIVEGGAFQDAAVLDALAAPGRLGLPGVVGARNPADNLSDFRAQIAANARGIALVGELIAQHGAPRVSAYMSHIQANAAEAVRDMLASFSARMGLPDVGRVFAEDFMDDGSPIVLAVTIDRVRRTAVFDFTGTGPQVLGNSNAPPAVTYSAVIYCLRCMVGRDIPLNQGCLEPVTFVIPFGCILNPSPEAAVVGGNVLTSQRVTDVVLKAFGAAAASQGCMNNFTFGDDAMGYYETLGGGAGAGPGWHGRSGVHTHMTNTRITDPELLERRYAVELRTFDLRHGSGGAGMWRGGEGLVREIMFLRPMTATILSERRALAPFGLMGGGEGKRGLNLLLRAARGGAPEAVINLGGKATVQVLSGDRIRLLTPGGGGYGDPTQKRPREESEPSEPIERFGGSINAEAKMWEQSA